MTDKNGKPNPWKDRFIRREIRTAGELLERFHDKNWRVHVDRQRAATEGSLNELGWIDEVKIAAGPPEIMYDGHLRVELVLEKYGPDGLVPCAVYGLTRKEADLALLTLDPIAAMAAADKAQLDALMREVQTGEAGLQAMIADLAEKEGIADLSNVDIAPPSEEASNGNLICCPNCGVEFEA